MQLLDQFDQENKQWYHHWLVYYLPVAILIGGVVMLTMKWPGARLVIVLGLFTTLIRSGIFFFAKKQSTSNWIYFIGRLILTVAIGIHIAFGPFHSFPRLLPIALCFYVVVALIKLFGNKNEKSESQNDPEDY